MLLELLNFIFSLNLIFRRLILISIDLVSILSSVFLWFWLNRVNINSLDFKNLSSFLVISIIITLAVYVLTQNYKGLARYFGKEPFVKLILRNLLSTLLISIFVFYSSSLGDQYYGPFLFFISLTFFTSITRLFMSELRFLILKINNSKFKKNIAIYGTNFFALNMINTLKRNEDINIICILDINNYGRSLNGIPIEHPITLQKRKSEIKEIYIAEDLNNLPKKTEIINILQETRIPIFKLNSINDLLTKNVEIKPNIESFKPISLEDLLGRQSINPDNKLLKKSCENKNVCITGAGGSIGSEICRQIIKFKPSKIVLIDNSELSLYELKNNLEEIINKKNNLEIKFVLGNILNKKFLEKTFKNNNINLIFHAAAYKHVPLVEINPIEGIKNNVIGTLSICEIVYKLRIENFVLISTDKAVRPTNVMGASKRLAELILKAYSEKIDKEDLSKLNISKTKMSIVRFGNVLGSSGSVIPLFEKQIRNGGPITITNRNIIRYFMTIQEAAQLVIQSVTLSQGGDIFLLDMGEPVLIRKLAEQMITLSGKKIKGQDGSQEGIEIKYTGLRPGEKLYEELLVDGQSEKTNHPLIYKSKEKRLNFKDLLIKVNELKENLDNQDIRNSLDVLEEVVKDWARSKINKGN